MKYTTSKALPLLDALQLLAPESSKTTLKQWIEEGRVLVDGEVVSKTLKQVHAGQTLSVGAKVKHRFLEHGVKLLYEDKDLVAIDKPEGLLSVATDFEKGETAHACLKRYFRPRQVHVVHRIDQETSGVMLFALSEEGREGLKKLFASHELTREYVAIVEGHLPESKGTWSSYLYEDRYYKMHTTQDTEIGQLAITHFLVDATSRRFSRLRLTLETGKKNQIRVHCRESSHPIVGDQKYGAENNSIKRLALHAHRLELIHPVTGKKLSFISPVPDAFKTLVP